MRLLIFSQPNSEHTRRFVEQCVRAGLTVGLVTTDRDRNKYYGLARHYRMKNHYGRFIPGTGIIRMWLHAQWIRMRFRPDIVHGHYITESGLRAGLSGGRPLVLTAWGSDIMKDAGELSGANRATLEWTMRRTAAITTNNAVLSEMCAQRAPRALMCSFRFGIDTTLFCPGEPPKEFRSSLGIPDGAFIVFSPRTTLPVYNIELVLKAFALLPNTAFLILKCSNASDPYVSAMKQFAYDRRLSQRIVWINEISTEQMRDLYRMADVVVTVPVRDALPVTFFEAWGVGVPVVTSWSQTYAEVVKDGHNAIVVKQMNPSVLAEVIMHIQMTPDIREKLRSAGKQTVEKFGDARKEFAKIVTLYQTLLGKKSYDTAKTS